VKLTGYKIAAPEYDTTVGVADALRIACAPGWLWTHFPAGEQRTGFAGVRLYRMGLQRGWPDFLLIDPIGVLHALELKKGKAAMRPDQRVFRDEMLKRGVPWAVARSLEEALHQLTEWGALLKLRISA
jgi:hypothetical protein